VANGNQKDDKKPSNTAPIEREECKLVLLVMPGKLENRIGNRGTPDIQGEKKERTAIEERGNTLEHRTETSH